MVPKKDGTMWLCTNFRKVSSIVHFDAYPVSWVEDLLEQMVGRSEIYLYSEYGHRELAEANTQEKTAFATRGWTR